MAVEVGRGFRFGVRSRGARAEVGYRVEMSIQRSPSRFVRVQRVQGERAREQQSQLWLEGRARDELDGARQGRGLGGRKGGPRGAGLGSELVLTLAVFDAFAGWPKTTERRESRSAACVPSSALSSRFSSASSSNRHVIPPLSLLSRLSSSPAAYPSRAEAQGEHEDLIRPARHKGLARQGPRPHVSTPPLPLLNIEDSSYRPLTPVSMGLVQLGCRACAPRRLYHCPPRQRCPRSPRAPRKLHRAARRLSRRQSVVSLFFVGHSDPDPVLPADTTSFVDALMQYLEAPHDTSIPLPYGNGKQDVAAAAAPMHTHADQSSPRDRKRPRTPPQSYPPGMPFKQPRITPNPFLYPAAGGPPMMPGFNGMHMSQQQQPPRGAPSQPCRDYHCKFRQSRLPLSKGTILTALT